MIWIKMLSGQVLQIMKVWFNILKQGIVYKVKIEYILGCVVEKLRIKEKSAEVMRFVRRCFGKFPTLPFQIKSFYRMTADSGAIGQMG